MQLEQKVCDNCHTEKTVIVSTNPLAKTLCTDCIASLVDLDSAADIRNISTTLQVPFDLSEYYTVALGSTTPEETMAAYFKHLEGSTPDNQQTFDWDQIDDHYHAATNFTVELARILPLKNALVARGAAKWGSTYSFHQLVELEAQYENTVRQYGVSSTFQKEAIKNAVRINVKIKDLIEAGEYADLRNATAAYKQFLEAAKVDQLVESSEDGTITTVAMLAEVIEKAGFQFNTFLPKVDKDDIDFLMDNISENTREIVYGATGLDVQIQEVVDKMQQSLEEKDATTAAETMILENDIDDDFMEAENQAYIKDNLEEEDFMDISFDDLMDDEL